MQLRILTESDRHAFKNFRTRNSHQQFLQSWEWGNFHTSLGHRVIRYGVFDNDLLLLIATLIQYPLPVGMFYWYCPRGPVMQEEAFTFFLHSMQKASAKDGALFVRIEPAFPLPDVITRFRIPRWVQPTHTQIIDLSQTEDVIQSTMKQKTRYNIRLALKKNIVVEASDRAEDFAAFWRMMQEVNKRQGIRSHAAEYYKTMLKQKDFAKLYVAKYQDTIIAAGIFIFSGDTVTYLHGGSLEEFRSLMAPYALQWKLIQDAKNAGFKLYDFGGTAPTDEPRHQLAGVTRFKSGFGGHEVAFPYRYDVIFRPVQYFIFSLAKKVRALFIKRLRT